MNKYAITIEEAKNIYNESAISFNLAESMNLQEPKLHTFCVGTPRSGTHSIASLFQGFRVEHEPDQVFMIELIWKIKNGQITQNQVKDILKIRDLHNGLEVDSSHYNGFFINELYSLFPNSKYILTIRDCISWLNSWFNHQLSSPKLHRNLIKDIGRSMYFDKGYSYTKYDLFFKNFSFFPLKSYLQFWYEHNSKIINTLSTNNLLVLDTDNISNSLSDISTFLQIDQSAINIYSSHEGKRISSFNFLQKVDTSFLIDTALEVCHDLNMIYFPDKDIRKMVRLVQKDNFNLKDRL